MNTFGWTMLAVPCVALVAGSFAVQVAPPRVAIQALASSASQELSDPDAWRERLLNKDLGLREQDFESLVSRAATSTAARAALETWSKDQKHLEFAWNCRLALREATARAKRVDQQQSFDDPFEALRQRMFRSHADNDPTGDFLMLDPFARGGPGLGGAFPAVPGGGNAHSESEGFSLELGPDGVKAHVKTNVNGEVHEEEYSARSMEELLAAHPELSARVESGDSGFQLRSRGSVMGSRQSGSPRNDRLGVYVPAQPEEGSTGLRIQSVMPGTLADELGLEAGQVLESINGRLVKTRDDISNALRERSVNAPLEVGVRDADGQSSTKSWKPNSQSRGEGRALEPQPLSGARKL